MICAYPQETDTAVKNSSADENSESRNMEKIWVEGLVPGIDFCNHSKSPNLKYMNSLILIIQLTDHFEVYPYFNKKHFSSYMQLLVKKMNLDYPLQM